MDLLISSLIYMCRNLCVSSVAICQSMLAYFPDVVVNVMLNLFSAKQLR